MYSMNGKEALRIYRRDQSLLIASIWSYDIFLSAFEQEIHSLLFAQACNINLLATEVVFH